MNECSPTIDDETPETEEEEMLLYGSVSAWAEKLGISNKTVRIKLSNEPYAYGVNHRGQVVRCYEERIVREKCVELFRADMPVADEDGFFKKDGERWGSVAAWDRVLPIDQSSIINRLEDTDGICGKNRSGRMTMFFSERIVKIRCSDLLQTELSVADKDGFFEKNGEKWGTIYSWSKELLLSVSGLQKRLKEAHGITGKSASKQLATFYSESTINEECTDLLEFLPTADVNGFFEQDGEKWGTSFTWAKELQINKSTIANRLEKATKIKGRLSGGQTTKFYSEAVVQEQCRDLLEDKLPIADADGFFYKDDERWGTIESWKKMLPISDTTIKRRLQNVIGIEARTQQGRIRVFFSEQVILENCGDLLEENLLVADVNGFFEQDGEKWGTAHAWSKMLSINSKTIKKKLRSVQVLNAKTAIGRLAEFYPENIVREKCAALLAAKQLGIPATTLYQKLHRTQYTQE